MWVYLPDHRTDSPSALEAEAWIWASCWPNPDFTPGVGSSGRNTPDPLSSQLSGPDTSLLHRSGTTSPHSTPDPLPGPSTPCSPDTPASRSATLDSAREPTTSATSGPMLPESRENSDQASSGSSSKTSQAMSLSVLKPCCETYETWVSRLRLASSRRLKLARRMSASASSLWPTAKALTGGANSRREERGAGGPDLQEAVQNWATPTAVMTRGGWTAEQLVARQEEVKQATKDRGVHQTGNGFGLSLAAQASIWNTPRASTGEYTRDRGVKGAERPTLEGRAAQWQTPVADDMVDRAKGKWNSRGEPKLSGQAAIWPTPMAGTPAQKGYNAAGNNDFTRKADVLADAVMASVWPTPAATQDTKGAQASAEAAMDREVRGKQLALADRALMFTRPDLPTWDGGLTYSAWRPISRRLFRLAMSSVPPTTLRRWLRGGNWRKRRLNPLFVSALMGWPIAHALCACSATAFTVWQQDMRGALSALPTASGPWIWLPPATVTAPEQMSLI